MSAAEPLTEPSPFARGFAQLSELGYSPTPVISASWPGHAGRGKCPGRWQSGGWQGAPGWEKLRDSPMSGFALSLAMKWPDANIGLVLGSPAGRDADDRQLFTISVDVDADCPDAVADITSAIPHSPMRVAGKKNFKAFYRAPATVVSRSFDDARVPAGQGLPRRLVDVLTGYAPRQAIVAPSRHPESQADYQWLAGPVRADELPIFDEGDMDRLVETLQMHGYDPEVSGQGRAERKPYVPADHDEDDVFDRVKAAALDDIGAWIHDVPGLYGLRPARGGYEAVNTLRSSSSGQPLERRKRNLSIQSSGIKDFGSGDTFSAIDLVSQFAGLSVSESVSFLEKRLGLAEDAMGVVIDFASMKANADKKVSAEQIQAATQVSASWAKPFAWVDPASIPPREWLYNHHLIRKFVSATFSPGGVGKSSLKLVEAMAMASGRPLLGVKPIKRLRVAYWNGEDPLDETQRRAMAIAIHYGLGPADLEEWLFLGSGREAEIVIAQQAPSGATIMAPVVAAITDDISAKGLDVVIVDPFVSCHRVTENDNGAVDLVAKTWGRLADATGTAVELVHHTRKTNGAETTAEDGRGASSLLAAVRSAQVLNLMTKDEAQRAGVDNHFAFFRADNGKANLAPRSDGATWYRFVGVDLGNASGEHESDKVGVVTQWSWPDPFDGVSANDLRAVPDRIDGGVWRENAQADEWVGNAVAEVMGLDLNDKSAKQKVKGLLAAWLKSGVLVRSTAKDEKRRDRPVIEVGRRVEAD